MVELREMPQRPYPTWSGHNRTVTTWIAMALLSTVYFTLAGTNPNISEWLTKVLPGKVDGVGLCLGGMGVAAGVLLVLAPRLRSQTRTELALVVGLSVFVTFPITRVEGITSSGLSVFSVLWAIIAATGLIGTKVSASPGRAVVLVLALGLLTATAVFGSRGGLLVLMSGSLVPGVTCFFLARRLDSEGLVRVSIGIVALATAQSLMAITEPFLFPAHLWAPAARGASGNIVPLLNGLLGAAVERSQASLGHPLPLGFLLAAGLALILRVIPARTLVKFLLVALLLAGLIFSGSRSSLILAIGLILFIGPKRLSAPRLLTVSLAFAGGLYIAWAAGVFNSSALTDFAASGSYTHRLAAYEAFSKLVFGQSLVPAVLGNGSGSTQRLFDAGLLQTDGFHVVDNEFVLMLSQGGLVALIAFIALCLRSLFCRNWRWRGAALVVVTNSLIFDWFSWPSCSSLGLFCLGAALAGIRRPDIAGLTLAEPVTRDGRLASTQLTPGTCREHPHFEHANWPQPGAHSSGAVACCQPRPSCYAVD